jgi:carbamoyltransferase
MIVLGLSPLDKDATVTLMIDGRVVAAVAEERLSRQKMHAGFPYGALETVLSQAGIKAADVDVVAYPFADWEQEAALMRKNWLADWKLNRRHRKERLSPKIRAAELRIPHRNFSVHGLSSAMETMQKPQAAKWFYRFMTADGPVGDLANRWQFRRWIDHAVADHRRFQQELLAGLRQFGLAEKLKRVEHHLTHVANAFYPSGFDRALVVTLDGYGTGLSGSVSVADEQGIRRLHNLGTPYSLGIYYEAVTAALGMRPDRHAGKVVGLAAYGDPEVLGDVLRSLFVWEDGGFRIRRSSDVCLPRRLSTRFPKIDLAAAYQTVLEEVVVRYVRHYLEQTSLDSVAISGGVAANVKLNQRIREIPGVRRIYIHPNMGDGGCGTGAAMVETVAAGQRLDPLPNAYLGPEYSDAEMEQALEAAGIQYERIEPIERTIAELVAAGEVVARFDGRMEYGPRALGNRSILYHATDPAVNQWLNTRLGRTEFMPFAPATLAEDRQLCYQRTEGAEFTAQFMTITFDCTEWMIQHCPAAVHVDGTARPQLVTKESNPGFHQILSHYKQITGLSSLINTSFNMHEEPIVCSPRDAVRAFLDGRLDYLVLGKFLAISPQRAARESTKPQQMASAR